MERWDKRWSEAGRRAIGCREREKGTVAPYKLLNSEGEEGSRSWKYCWARRECGHVRKERGLEARHVCLLCLMGGKGVKGRCWVINEGTKKRMSTGGSPLFLPKL